MKIKNFRAKKAKNNSIEIQLNPNDSKILENYCNMVGMTKTEIVNASIKNLITQIKLIGKTIS